MTESHEHRIKRLKMRSMRRGIKEMDIILSAFAEAHLDQLSKTDLALYEQLLNEADLDMYRWISGQAPAPEHYTALLKKIADEMAATLT